MLALLSAIPGIGRIVTALTESVFNAKVKLTQARIGGDRDVAVEIVKNSARENEARVSALAIVAGNKVLMFLVVGFAAPLMIFVWKVVVWDIVLGWGATDPIKGQVAEWGNTIIWFIFGAPTAMSLGKMWFDRRTN